MVAKPGRISIEGLNSSESVSDELFPLKSGARHLLALHKDRVGQVVRLPERGGMDGDLRVGARAQSAAGGGLPTVVAVTM